jgi:hypothetical protein
VAALTALFIGFITQAMTGNMLAGEGLTSREQSGRGCPKAIPPEQYFWETERAHTHKYSIGKLECTSFLGTYKYHPCRCLLSTFAYRRF